jgi:hypothetical protein
VRRIPHLGNTEMAPVRLDSMFSPTALSQEKAAVPTPPFYHERNSHVRVPHFRTWKYGIVETLWITSRRRFIKYWPDNRITCLYVILNPSFSAVHFVIPIHNGSKDGLWWKSRGQKIVLFLAKKPCSSANESQNFGDARRLHFQSRRLAIYLKDTGYMKCRTFIC